MRHRRSHRYVAQFSSVQRPKVLMLASVASMIIQFNMPNIQLMQEMGYEVHVACNFKEGSTCGRRQIKEFCNTLQRMHVVYHQWDCPRKSFPVAKCRKAYRQLWELTGRYRYEWVHCHSPIGGALARMVGHKRKMRIVYTAHGFHFYRGAPVKNWLLYYPVEKLLAHSTDVLITVNREDEQFARRHLAAAKVLRIPGIGIELPKYEQAKQTESDRKKFRRKYRIPQEALLLLSVGELNRGKNHSMVIEALAALSRKDVYYMVCGQGELHGRLLQQANRLGVGDRIRLTGYMEDMPHVYQNADVFVFPSVREGMPAALMEAMAAGLPCVVSDIRGNRELIGDEMVCDMLAVGNRLSGGIRFSLRRPEQLCLALEQMFADKRLRQICGQYNREKIKGYGQEAVQKKMLMIYRYMERVADRHTLYVQRGKNAGDFSNHGDLQCK